MIVEIRAAEGGDDAKGLVREQMAIYVTKAKKIGVQLELIDEGPAMVVFRAKGKKGDSMFQDEGGGHRWQRVPPNEKRGRVHTSTVTVAVLPEVREHEVGRDVLEDCRIVYTVGSGPGGQHRNKTESCVTITHLPSGLSARCDATPHQATNRELAITTLLSRLAQQSRDSAASRANESRRRQVGSGMRGDKRRTVRVRDNRVTDHKTDRRWTLSDYQAGNW